MGPFVLCVPWDRCHADPLPNTQSLEDRDDLAVKMVAGIDKYLTRELAASPDERKQHWKPDFSSPAAYAKSVEPNRQRLKRTLGIVDPRVPVVEVEYVATTRQASVLAETERYRVHAVRWPVFAGVDAEGLLLEPKGKPLACV